jgi:hypothetical protein
VVCVCVCVVVVVVVVMPTRNRQPGHTHRARAPCATQATFSYSVKWSPTTLAYDQRLERYNRLPLNPVHLEIHWCVHVHLCVHVQGVCMCMAVLARECASVLSKAAARPRAARYPLVRPCVCSCARNARCARLCMRMSL